MYSHVVCARYSNAKLIGFVLVLRDVYEFVEVRELVVMYARGILRLTFVKGVFERCL